MMLLDGMGPILLPMAIAGVGIIISLHWNYVSENQI